MDKQEIFDTVALHLIKQGKRSADDDGQCLYRGPRGLKCAIGCLLTDEEYLPAMENKTVNQLISRWDRFRWFICNRELLTELQGVHDDTFFDFARRIKEKLRDVAQEFNLSSAVLDEQKIVDDRFNPSKWGL